MLRRDVMKGLAAGAATLAAAVRAQAGWPERPIRIISPFPPGGGTDFIARLLASQLNETRQWNCIVDNRAGANGTLGLSEAARANAAGYDFVVGQKDNAVISAHLSPVGFDTLRDFAPVGLMGTTPIVILAAGNSPFTNFRQVIDKARAEPGKLTLASSGNGSVSHITSELLRQKADIVLQHVPYKGSNPAMVDLVGGHVDLVGGSIASAVPFLESGKMRALAVSTARRSPRLPDVPTIAELGFPDFEVTAWWGLLGPRGVPAPIITAMNAAMNAALAQPSAVKALLGQGVAAETGSPETFADFLARDFTAWKKIIAETGVRAS